MMSHEVRKAKYTSVQLVMVYVSDLQYLTVTNEKAMKDNDHECSRGLDVISVNIAAIRFYLAVNR